MGYRWQWWALLPIMLPMIVISAILYLIEFALEGILTLSRYALALWLPITGWVYEKAHGKKTKAITRQNDRARWYRNNATVTHC